jgi:tricorn protease
MRFPDVQGDTIVFTYAGDLWTSKLDGGFARRLTSHPALETRARFSPDGKTIAFSAEYDGNVEVYTIAAEGGEPQRLTFQPEADEVIGWTPDGKVMFTSANGFFTGQQRSLFTISPEGGLPTRSVIRDISEGSMSADGRFLAYTRGRSHLFNWRRYRGGTQGRISLYRFADNNYRELPTGREQNYYPMVVGNFVYYISDRNQGTLNLYRHDLRNGREAQLTKFTDADIRFPATDGKTLVFERDGYLFRMNLPDGEIAKVEPKIRSDFPTMRTRVVNHASQIAGISISPSGNRVAVDARGELFTLPARTGEVRNLSNSPASREMFSAWSPDGKSIAYVSDKSGEREVYIQPQMGGEATKLTDLKRHLVGIEWSPDSKSIAVWTRSNELHLVDVATKEIKKVYQAKFSFGGFDFSADSKWIAYTDQTGAGMGKVMLYEVATGKTMQVTSGKYNDGSPTFDLSGKYLYFASFRSFLPNLGGFEIMMAMSPGVRIYMLPLTKDLPNPLLPPSDEEPSAPAAAPAPPAGGAPVAPAKPVSPEMKIDLEGIENRAIPLPMPAGGYGMVAGLREGLLYASPAGIARFDVATRESTPIAPFAGPVSVNPARTKLAYLSGGTLGIVDIRPGITPGQGRVETSALDATIDPLREMRQMFWEAWRYMRDNFYDPNMRGLNWQAIGLRYEQYLPYVRHRSDLDFVLGLMIGEVGTGHSYVFNVPTGATPVPVGQLGAEYAVDGDKIKISKILGGSNYDESRRSPLAEPGVNVKVGDYLLAIDGQPVTATTVPGALLINKVGRTVVLTVNEKPTMEGSRTVRVRPIGSEQPLRYVEYVETTRKAVEQASGGRIAYMHVPDTAVGGIIGFVRDFYNQTDREALLVDERWNGGGFLPTFFVETLSRKAVTMLQGRNQQADEPDRAFIPGPKAMLINEYAGSGGDMLPYLFREAKLGPLIGTRTWGGLVGITGSSGFVDGGGITAPEFSIYNPRTNQIVAENTGVDPDIDVDARPDLIAQGKDPQLERAIQYLLDQLKRRPARPQRTTIPRVEPKGRVGG